VVVQQQQEEEEVVRTGTVAAVVGKLREGVVNTQLDLEADAGVGSNLVAVPVDTERRVVVEEEEEEGPVVDKITRAAAAAAAAVAYDWVDDQGMLERDSPEVDMLLLHVVAVAADNAVVVGAVLVQYQMDVVPEVVLTIGMPGQQR
jgi:hypothetical protein